MDLSSDNFFPVGHTDKHYTLLAYNVPLCSGQKPSIKNKYISGAQR